MMSSRRRAARVWVATIVGAIVVALLLVGFVALGSEDGSRAQSAPVTVDEIADNPDAFRGETVTVTGKIHDVVSPKVFAITGDVLGRPEPKVLVVDRGEPGAEVSKGESIKVTGMVRQFDADEFREEIQVELESYGGSPVILASSVEVMSQEVGDGRR